MKHLFIILILLNLSSRGISASVAQQRIISTTRLMTPGTAQQRLAGNGAVTAQCVPGWGIGHAGDTVWVDSAVIYTAFKVPVPYMGVTNGSGVYSVTYTTPYATTPNIQKSIRRTSDAKKQLLVTSSTRFGFSITSMTWASISILGSSVLLAVPVTSSGDTVEVLVTPY